MASKDDKIRKILKKNWPVEIDQGHKSALKHKMAELEACEHAQEDLEYTSGDWTTRSERLKTRTIIRTDWRPVWAAAIILLAVVIILVPSRNLTSTDTSSQIQSASPYDIIIKNEALATGDQATSPGTASTSKNTKLESRYIYLLGDLTYESKIVLKQDQVVKKFKELGVDAVIEPSKIQMLTVMVPEGYYLETREGETIYYSIPAED